MPDAVERGEETILTSCNAHHQQVCAGMTGMLRLKYTTTAHAHDPGDWSD